MIEWRLRVSKLSGHLTEALTTHYPSRRRFLAGLAGTVAAAALLAPAHLRAQEVAPVEAAPEPAPVEAAPPAAPQPQPFSYEILTEAQRLASESAPPAPEAIEGFLADLDYDGYQRIRFRPARARWQDPAQNFRLHAFHLGWLFEEPVHIHEIVEGNALPMDFSTADFEYGGALAESVPADAVMPGVAGFRLHTPLNRADIFDELIAFLGASYFRALGRDTVYGLSARGLAVNTALSGREEFPRFTDFWLERPLPGQTSVTLYAALASDSVTGAYRFVITPGENTVVEVTARLFLRADVAQLGLAPLTSMFLFGGADPGAFEDFRAAVHDSEYLVLNSREGDTYVRALNNPVRLASSYLRSDNPASFGLVQRSRDFGDYLDAQAHYESRPSLMVEPLGDWGRGSVRLVEIPSDLEGNDNIVAFWVPEGDFKQGNALELSYRLHWGRTPPGDRNVERATILRTRAGHGGVAGVAAATDRRKFVIDFQGGLLGELSADADVSAQVSADRGVVTEAIVSKISGTEIWRLVLEVQSDPGAVVELRASVTGFDRVLTETWLYQWVRE